MTQRLPDVRPIPVKDRYSFLFVERGHVDVLDGTLAHIDASGTRTLIPVGNLACLLLEPGIRISHRAVGLAAAAGCLICWVGEGGVRVYAAGQPGGARSDRLLYQARLALDPKLRLKVVRNMFQLRFGEIPPARRSIEQLRGIEGARVRKMYTLIAQRHGLKWEKRNYNVQDWNSGSRLNRCLSAATACLYGITEAAVLAAGYAPAIGFLHTGKPLSFVYDVADLVKFDTVVPVAFRIAAGPRSNADREVRLACRDHFRETRILRRLIPLIQKVLEASGELPPEEPSYAVGPAFAEQAPSGDVGHRS